MADVTFVLLRKPKKEDEKRSFLFKAGARAQRIEFRI